MAWTKSSGKHGHQVPEFDEIARLLATETAIVTQLTAALQAQRAAVASDDPDGVEASVRAIGSSLMRLDETRRARAKIAEALTGDPNARLERLESTVGASFPAEVRENQSALRRAAEAAAHEATLNRAALGEAIDAGEMFLQALLSSSGPARMNPSTD